MELRSSVAYRSSCSLVESAISVVLAHAILLQEVVLVHARDLKRNLVILADGVFAYKLKDLREVLFFLKKFLGLCTQFDKTWLCGIVIRLENLNISGVREVPVDGRKVLSVDELLIENTPVA